MTSPPEAKLEILADPEALARRVADWLLAAAMAKDGVFAVALSGGSTPRRLYERLAKPPYHDVFPWSRTHWFWGDERFVPHDDALSNDRMVLQALLSRAPFPGTAVLAERKRWVAVVSPKSEARITLTYPALESSRHTAFLVAGEEKLSTFERLRRGDNNLPAARLHPTGTLCLFADIAAAGEAIL